MDGFGEPSYGKQHTLATLPTAEQLHEIVASLRSIPATRRFSRLRTLDGLGQGRQQVVQFRGQGIGDGGKLAGGGELVEVIGEMGDRIRELGELGQGLLLVRAKLFAVETGPGTGQHQRLAEFHKLGRQPAATAAKTAVRSAQLVSPYDAFSTLQPAKSWPSSANTAAPTGNFE